MAELAALTGATLISKNASAVDIVRGVRVALNSSGLVAVADITVRGDYVSATAVTASTAGAFVAMQQGAIVPALASEAAAIGDPAYGAASGKFSKTSGGGAVLCGVWCLAASGNGVLGEVQLSNPL